MSCAVQVPGSVALRRVLQQQLPQLPTQPPCRSTAATAGWQQWCTSVGCTCMQHPWAPCSCRQPATGCQQQQQQGAWGQQQVAREWQVKERKGLRLFVLLSCSPAHAMHSLRQHCCHCCCATLSRLLCCLSCVYGWDGCRLHMCGWLSMCSVSLLVVLWSFRPCKALPRCRGMLGVLVGVR